MNEPQVGTPEYDAAMAEWEKVEYKHNRIIEYYSYTIGDQLDNLWHDIDAGLFGSDAKTGNFYTGIKSVKDKHPKPS